MRIYKRLNSKDKYYEGSNIPYVDILQVLENEGKEIDEYTAHNATQFGKIDVLEWLEKRGILPDSSDARYAGSSGYVDVLIWLAKRGILPGDDAWYKILDGRNTINVLQWLLIDGPKDFPDLFASDEGEFVGLDYIGSVYIWAIRKYKDIRVLKWLYAIFGQTVDVDIAGVALESDNLQALQWITEEKGVFPDQFYLNLALEEEAWSTLGWMTQYAMYPDIKNK